VKPQAVGSIGELDLIAARRGQPAKVNGPLREVTDGVLMTCPLTL
jgi:hypothetical protein